MHRWFDAQLDQEILDDIYLGLYINEVNINQGALCDEMGFARTCFRKQNETTEVQVVTTMYFLRISLALDCSLYRCFCFLLYNSVNLIGQQDSQILSH